MTTTSKRLTFCAGLTLVFIGLKLFKIIHWSWWWILSPVWIPTVAGIITYIILVKHIAHRNKKSAKWKKMIDMFNDVSEESRNL